MIAADRSFPLDFGHFPESPLQIHSPNLTLAPLLTNSLLSPARTLSNSSPNPFQMLLFLHSADVALADVPFCHWLAPVVNFVIGECIFET